MENPVTIVTAFFDINREEKGDGRKLDDYLIWMKETLKLNCNLFIITEEKFKDFFVANRRPDYNTCIQIIDFKQLYYYKYYDRIKEILDSDEYKTNIQNPDRVECVLPEYNIIQYSKFHCLKIAIELNIFNSEFFLWMDAGVSRFFMDVDINLPFPGENTIQFMRNNLYRFIIQHRQDLSPLKIDNNFIWKSDNLLYGTLFGGSKYIIPMISELVEKVFINDMLNKNNVNNEQIALSIVWKKNPHLFSLLEASQYCHLILFKVLSK